MPCAAPLSLTKQRPLASFRSPGPHPMVVAVVVVVVVVVVVSVEVVVAVELEVLDVVVVDVTGLHPFIRPDRRASNAAWRWVLGVGCWVLGVGCWVLGRDRDTPLFGTRTQPLFEPRVFLDRVEFDQLHTTRCPTPCGACRAEARAAGATKPGTTATRSESSGP